ncbi:MAG: hypothetical protein ACYTHJ_12390 [Planctomycetota bacterium]
MLSDPRESNGEEEAQPERAGAHEQRWHLDVGFRTSYTKLGDTEQMLDRRLDWPMKADVLGLWSHPYTPIDRKTDGHLNALSLGFGRYETDWLDWSVYFVGGGISDHDHQRIGNLNLETHFRYGNYLLGLKTEVYPFGRPHGRCGSSFQEMFQQSRPFLFTGVETGYVSGEGRGSFRFAPITLYRDSEKVRDWVVGFPIGIGYRIPLDHNWSFSLTADYSFQAVRAHEYAGWNVNVGLRYEIW